MNAPCSLTRGRGVRGLWPMGHTAHKKAATVRTHCGGLKRVQVESANSGAGSAQLQGELAQRGNTALFGPVAPGLQIGGKLLARCGRA